MSALAQGFLSDTWNRTGTATSTAKDSAATDQRRGAEIRVGWSLRATARA